MRKYFLLLAVTLFIIGCETSDPVPEIFTFKVNGEEMDFSGNINVGKNIAGEILIQGKKSGTGIISIVLHEPNEGRFTEADYSMNMDDLTVQYTIMFDDADENKYYYSSSNVNSWFIIDIERFDNRTDGELTGEFSGLLTGSMLNSKSAVDSVVIENGRFSTSLAGKIN